MFGKKLVSLLIWSVVMLFVLLMAMLLAYYVGGEVEFELKSVKLGMVLIGNLVLNGVMLCIVLFLLLMMVMNFVIYIVTMSGMDCDVYGLNVGTETFIVWLMFIVYMIVVVFIIFWFIFLVYVGVGIVVLLVDMIKGFMNRL